MEIKTVRFDLEESDETEDIILCLNTLFSVRTGSIPLNREIGLDGSAIAGVAPVAETNVYYDILEKVEAYEPRVTVEDIEFLYEENYMIPVVKLQLAEREVEDNE